MTPRTRTIAAIVFFGFVSAALPAAGEPRAVIPEPTYRFGAVLTGTVVEHEFVIANEGAEPLRIQGLRLTPPLTAARMSAVVAPGARAVLRVTLDTSSLKGVFEGEIIVSLSDTARDDVRLTFVGEVRPPIELLPLPALYVATRRGQSSERSIELVNHEPEPLTIEAVEHSSSRFATSVETIEAGRRYRLTLRLAGDGVGGRQSDVIRVTTSSKRSRVLTIPANTYIRERVSTFPEAVDLGQVRLADLRSNPTLIARLAQTLMVYGPPSDFEIVATTSVPALGLAAARGPAGDRYQITVTLKPEGLERGPISGSIVIKTNDPEFAVLSVPVTGAIVE